MRKRRGEGEGNQKKMSERELITRINDGRKRGIEGEKSE